MSYCISSILDFGSDLRLSEMTVDLRERFASELKSFNLPGTQPTVLEFYSEEITPVVAVSGGGGGGGGFCILHQCAHFLDLKFVI